MNEKEANVIDSLAQSMRQALLADSTEGQIALDRLEVAHHAQFVAVCHILLRDEDMLIQKVALRKLGQYGDRDDALAEKVAIAVLAQEQLRDTAFFALGTIGTRNAFPILFDHAQLGNAEAFSAMTKQTRTDEQRNHILHLARINLFSNISAMRYYACEILQSLSDVLAEEHLFLASCEVFADEFVIYALRNGSAYALPRLQRILHCYPADSVQAHDLQQAVDMLAHRFGVE